MNSDFKTFNTIFVGILVVTFAVIANFAIGISPLTQTANAKDIDLDDLKCIGIFFSCEDSSSNEITNNNTNNVTVTQVCNNNAAEGNVAVAIDALNNKTCSIGDMSFDSSPSVLDLS
jgi:hypothetical protein